MNWSVWLIISAIWIVVMYLERRSHRKLLKAMEQNRDEWEQIAEHSVETLTESNNQLLAAHMELDNLRAFRDSVRRTISMPENASEEIRDALRTGRVGLVNMERDIANRNVIITLSDGRRFTIDENELQGIRQREAPDEVRTRLYNAMREAAARADLGDNTLRVQLPQKKAAADIPPLPQREGRRKINIPGVQAPARKT